jgi:hypothetical protein
MNGATPAKAAEPAKRTPALSPARRDGPCAPSEPALTLAGNQAMQALLRGGWLRPKLELGAPDDPEELEADAVAERVMRMPEGACCASCAKGGACGNETVRRRPEAAAAPARPSLPHGLEHQVGRLTTGGEPLSPHLRAFFEPRLGRDLNAVRVHHDRPAQEAAAAISAKAFTVGEHVGFGQGHWSPESSAGRCLLAHELAHTGQTGAPIRRQAAGATSGTAPASVPAPAASSSSAGTMDPDRLRKIRAILANRWVGPLDEYELESIWDSFGANLPAVANENFDLWRACIDRGAELYDIPNAVKYRNDFERDVKDSAALYLSDNRDFIIGELRRFGLLEGQPPDPEQQRRALDELREAARTVRRAKEAQSALQQIPVGYDYESIDQPGGGFKTITEVATFTPLRPPMRRPRGDEDPPMARWEDIKVESDRQSDVILGLINRFPTLASLNEQGQLEAAASDDQSRALAAVNTSLREVLAKIERTVPKIDNNDLDYRDLKPIHDQLMHGTAAVSRRPWQEPFYKGVIEGTLADHEAKEFWIGLGLGTLAAAAFVVAEIATVGTATFFIAAGVGVAAGAVQAGRSWERYFDLAEAARTNMTPGRSLVTSGQASAALLSAIVDSAFALVDLYAPAARAIRGAAGAAERGAAFAARRAVIEAEQRELAERAAREMAEAEAGRVTSEGAAEAVGRRIGEAAGQSLIRRIRQVIQDFIQSIKRWAREVYQRFGFREYVVEVEGEWLSLYGIRSKVLLARFRRDAIEAWVVENSPDLQAARHSRASQLGAARSAALSGDDALAAMLRGNAVRVSEEIGELAAQKVVTSRFPSAVLVHQGASSGTVDLIFRLGDGSLVIVEAKGGAGRLITREIAPGVRAEQGTVGYLRSVLGNMRGRPGEAAIAQEALDALNGGRLRYFLSETPVPRGTASLETRLSEFRTR